MRIVLFVLAVALADTAVAGSDPNLPVGVRSSVADVGSGAVNPAAAASRDLLALDVPYLPQTDALCGGAAVAMVFRYWGHRHADVQQFAPLVERRAGGIATDVLTRAVKDRRWDADEVRGSVEVIRRSLAAGQPLILLLEDRPGRFHYVVAVAVDGKHVWLHDPTWGPSRKYAIPQLMQTWEPADFWALRILPRQNIPAFNASHPDPRPGAPVPSTAVLQTHGSPLPATSCDRALAQAVAEVRRLGLESADSLLAEVRARCPDASGPVSELAGVRFAQHRFVEAESLARKAAASNPEDTYAWDVLGSSRFVQEDLDGALQAWNRVGKPYLDSIRIQGLHRTRYSLVAETLRLTPNALVNADSFRLARRRLDQLPDRLDARIGFRPEADGFAVVDVTVAERPLGPRNVVGWSAVGAYALVNRDVTMTVPGWSGQGEVWSGSWRWWDERPRVALAFAAPRIGQWPGVWRVDASWDAQTYAIGSANRAIRESQKQASVGVTDWLTPQLRYALTVGARTWETADERRKAFSIGGTLERRWVNDRIALSGTFQHGVSLSNSGRYQAGSVHASMRIPAPRGFVQLAEVHAEAVSERAPMSLWPGSGEGQGRPNLLRAHPLLKNGVIDGPAFGQRLLSLTLESQRWFKTPAFLPAGIAVFSDLARAWRRLDETPQPFQVDMGVGLRLRAPGDAGALRIDYARGLRDGSYAITIGVALRHLIQL
jgi:hypothetical protein